MVDRTRGIDIYLPVDGNNFPTSIAFVPNTDGIFGAYMSSDDPNFSTFTVGEAVPEPSASALAGLGLLALGAMGVRELRRRKSGRAGKLDAVGEAQTRERSTTPSRPISQSVGLK